MIRLAFLVLLFSFFSKAAHSQSVTLVAPNVGEAYHVNDVVLIEWASTGVNKINLELSRDGGTSWDTIATLLDADSMYYRWSPGYIPSTNCLVRISDATNSNVSDNSQVPFSISPAISLISLDGGQLLMGGTSTSITWNAPLVPLINIDYSLNNGASWIFEADSLPASAGSFLWQIPRVFSDSVRIRLTDASFPVSEVSWNTFKITSPYISIVQPSGGEHGILSTTSIKWKSSEVTFVKIEYSIDSGSTWSTIQNSYPASLENYNWVVPNTPSDNCLVRVTNTADSSMRATSVAAFSIPEISVRLTAPNTSEPLARGQLYTIQWKSSGVTNVEFHYSTNNGATWVIFGIDNSTSGIGSRNWIVPTIISDSCLVRIRSVADTTISDVSDYLFPIKTVVLKLNNLSPNTVLNNGITYTIRWNQWYAIKLDLYYSVDSGSTWILIADHLSPTANQYNWQVPANYSTKCLIKIIDSYNQSWFDIIDDVFTIAPSYLKLVQPNGGEIVNAYSNYLIRWTYKGIQSIKLEYSADSGSTWNLINSFVYIGNFANSYGWNVPLVPSTKCLIRVTDLSNGQLLDISDSCFTIAEPALELTEPYSGQSINSRVSNKITWTSSSISKLKIEFSLDSASTWSLVADSVPAVQGYYNWNPPDTNSTNCFIRLTDEMNPGLVSQNDSVFSLKYLRLVLTSPVYEDTLIAGAIHKIRWENYNVQHVKIHYSLNNGVSWTPIVTYLPGSDESYDWLVPNIVTGNCRIKIYDVSDPLNINCLGKPFQIFQTSGVEDAISTLDISLFPNPASSILSIRVNTQDEVLISIFEVNGRIVIPARVEGSGLHIQNIPVESLVPGVYFVRIDAGDQRVMTKFLIAR